MAISPVNLDSLFLHAQADARGMDDVEAIDLGQGRRMSASTARWVMITSGTGLPGGASSPGSCWMTLAMLISCSPRTFARAASTPGRSAIVKRR